MTTAPRTVGVRLEYERNAFVPVPRPRISWRTATDAPDWQQTAAEIEFATGDEVTAVRLDGPESVFAEWPFDDLSPETRGSLRVRTEGTDGLVSEWSAAVAVRAAFLAPSAWHAEFVTSAQPSRRAEPFLTRFEFEVREGLASATLYATAQGAYQAFVNGREVDDQVLKPGWTPYAQRLVHETTDVAGLLRPGRNALGASVAGGWFTEIFGFREGAAPVYGDQPSFAAQLVLRYDDGSVDEVISGSHWRTSSGPITESGLYAGERYDARLLPAGWSEPEFDDAHWAAAATRVVDVTPTPRTSPAVRETQRVAVEQVSTSPSGKLLLDFGQNLVGRLEVRVAGPSGTEIVLRHAEVLEDGELSVRPLRRADSIDRLILGDAEEVWQPAFTYHGFRYAQIDGWPGEFDPSAVTAVVIHSDMPRTGWFTSSHDLVNRFHESVVWGMRGNFFYLPTDCPQRDERLGWLGDIQVFAPTASYLYDADGFLASWMVDVALEQRAIGGVPFIVPNVLDSARLPTAAWGDAATIVPWTLYERFGDKGVLGAQFESMRAWVDQVLELAGSRRLWEGSFQFGDWLDPTAPVDRPADAKTDPDLVASAYLYRSARIVAAAAEVLGFDDIAARYSGIADEVHAAWLAEYATPGGRLMSDSQAAYAIAIRFELLSGAARRAAGSRLAALVRKNGYRIGTGFVGTPLVQDALVETGHVDAAARLMTQTELPSWLYPVTMGATTVWERWDSLLEDGSVNPGEMTSFNHYALGAVADWLHRVVGGLAPAAPGYRRIRIAPTPLPGFDHAESSHDTPYGRAMSRWSAVEGTITVTAIVPPNTRAEIALPGRESFEVGAGQHEWTIADPRSDGSLPGEVTLETPLSQIIDDREAYETVWKSIAEVSPEIARRFRTETPWLPEQTLRSSTIDTPAIVFAALTDALGHLNARRRG